MSNFRGDISPGIYTRACIAAQSSHHNESDYHRDLSTALKSGCWNAVRTSLAHRNRNSCGRPGRATVFESAFESCIGNSRRFQVSIDFYRTR